MEHTSRKGFSVAITKIKSLVTRLKRKTRRNSLRTSVTYARGLDYYLTTTKSRRSSISNPSRMTLRGTIESGVTLEKRI
jgi:hypothetical protein